MPIWLGGVGRSDADLARLVAESDGGRKRIGNRRVHKRHDLEDARGELVYRGVRHACVVVNLSLSGCCLEVEKHFRHGALAQVQLVLPILDMVLHIGGVTQWLKRKNRMGMRFTHVSSKSKAQLGALVACVAGIKTPQEVIENFASVKLNQSTGDVLIAKPVVRTVEQGRAEAPKAAAGQLAYNPAIHQGEGRVVSLRRGAWRVSLRSPEGHSLGEGDFIDLSLNGCTVRTAEPYLGLPEDSVKLSFELESTRLLLIGICKIVYDQETVAISFNLLSRRKREQLEMAIGELCAEAGMKLGYS
jgi:hypothetical protein